MFENQKQDSPKLREEELSKIDVLEPLSAEELMEHEMKQVEFEPVEIHYRPQVEESLLDLQNTGSYANFDSIFTKIWELYQKSDCLPKREGSSIQELSPIFFLITIRNIKNLDTTLNLHKEKIEKLCKKAYDLLLPHMTINMPGKERYVTQLLCEIIEVKTKVAIEILKNLNGKIPFDINLQMQAELDCEEKVDALLSKEKTLITDSLFNYEETKSNLPQLEDLKIKSLKEISENFSLVELYTQINLALHKTYIQGRFYKLVCDLVLQTKIPAYREFCRNKILPLYSKIVLMLEQPQCNYPADVIFESTYGNAVWNILER